MDEDQGCVIRQSILFVNGRSFALGEYPRGGLCDVVIRQGTGQLELYWGHYYDDEAATEKTTPTVPPTTTPLWGAGIQSPYHPTDV